jgi:preprotein translocase subunit SecE
MAKTALVAGEQTNNPKVNQLTSWVTTNYDQGRNFLTDVRAEMRKVVVPSRKEVQATTTVVLVTVFVFAFYFWVVDSVFTLGLNKLLSLLVGPQ